MQVGLNCPWCPVLGAERLAQFAALGVQVIRTDVPDEGDIAALVTDFAGASVRPLFLLHSLRRHHELLVTALQALGPNGFDVEVYNEPPGMDKVDQATYAADILTVYDAMRNMGIEGRCITGGLANLSETSLQWMRTTAQQMPADVTIGAHDYPYQVQQPRRAWPNSASLDDALARVRSLAGPREVAITEFGYHGATERVGQFWWAKSIRMTDEQIRAQLAADLQRYAQHGIALACIYQWRDEPAVNGTVPDRALARYGVCDANGTPKPQAAALAGVELRT